MTGGTFAVTIDRTPEQVWPWVADLGKHAAWSPKAYAVEWTGGEPNTVGSRYRSVGWIPFDRHHVNEGEITEVVPNERFALRADDPLGPFPNVFTLTAIPGGTRVALDLRFPELHGLTAVMAPMLFPLVGKRDLRKRMALLKRTVEAATATPA
jgi:uncharacterized protein YndB with AHSA1/START domain